MNGATKSGGNKQSIRIEVRRREIVKWLLHKKRWIRLFIHSCRERYCLSHICGQYPGLPVHGQMYAGLTLLKQPHEPGEMTKSVHWMWSVTSGRGKLFFRIRFSSSLGLFRTSLFVTPLWWQRQRHFMGLFLYIPTDSLENFQEF